MPKIETLIFVTKDNVQYLEQCIKSAQSPIIIFDGIAPIGSPNRAYQCNAGRSSIAKNFALSKIDLNSIDFIQFLDADDFLHKNYYSEISLTVESNKEYSMFFSDYLILNEDFNFTNREFITSLCGEQNKDNALKVKNPLIRANIFNKIKFNDEMCYFEFVDLISKMKTENCYHIPSDLQTVRIHPKSSVRSIRREEAQRSFKLIDWKNNG